MIQKNFAERVVKMVRNDTNVLGLAVAGSWITNEIDEFSDLDLVLVTSEAVSPDKEKMLAYAKTFGKLLTGFTGEHVGEPRLLICLYDDPLLHVDIKFLTLSEIGKRVEDFVILFERNTELSDIFNTTNAIWPYPDYQWIEDRFWIWVHYVTLKMGRGEWLEALDFLSFLRTVVLSPLLQVKNGLQPRGLRKVERTLSQSDMDMLVSTIAVYEPSSIFTSLTNAIELYRSLRKELFPAEINLQRKTEEKSMQNLKNVQEQTL
jgi:predicted nucleotidyltransferase